MTFKKNNFKKIYKSFIWITAIVALIAGFSLYECGTDSWRILNYNEKIHLEYIIRLALTALAVFISFSTVLFMDLKAGKKLTKFKNLAIIVFISLILDVLLYTSFASYLIFVGKIESFRFIASLFYLNQIVFIVGIFLYVFKYKLYSTSKCIRSVLKDLLVIFLFFIIISTILFYGSGSNVRFDLIIVSASVIISVYSALFVPIQLRAFTIKRKDKESQ